MASGTPRIGATALGAGGATATAAHPGAAALQPGDLLDGRYRIQALLGTGGMGSVYRAEHEAIGRAVAIKVLHPEFCASAGERERFRREARVAVKLRSPHVAEVLDFGEDADGRLFLVMELLQGEPVRDVLAREGQLAPERTVRLLRQLLAGLGAAHAAGIVHRDLKPENLWVDGSGPSERLRLLDFGIAKWTGPADAAQTQAGLVVGTPEYLAPEQAVGGEVDARADLYSAGILAFVLLTGRHPFDTRDVRALLAAHAYRAVPSPSTLEPELAAYPRLLEAVARATQKDRDRRPASAAELLKLLEGAEFPVRLSRTTPGPARPAPPPALVAARASLLGIPAAAMPDVVNLTLVRVQIAGWERWAKATSAAFRARHLAAHDARVLPLVRAFGGQRIEAREGGSVFAFRSPTDGVHCAAALQDAAAALGRAREVERLELQIGVHQGEIHLDHRGGSGAPLATVRALAEAAAPGEVWLTRGVYLTMSRSEAPAEEVGPRSLAGLAEPVPTYRLTRTPGPAPYGGRHGAVPRPAGGRGRAGAAAALASIQVAGDTEGRLPAVARVLGSGAALAALGALEAAAGGLHAALYRAHRALRPDRPRPGGLERLLELLERTRRLAARPLPRLALALGRPLRGA